MLIETLKEFVAVSRSETKNVILEASASKQGGSKMDVLQQATAISQTLEKDVSQQHNGCFLEYRWMFRVSKVGCTQVALTGAHRG